MASKPLEAPDINPVVIYTPVPLVVLERCHTTYQLAVWIALRWLLAAYPDAEGFSYYQIGKRAGVDREEVARLLSELLALGLIVIAGPGRVLRAPGERQKYSIDLADLVQASVSSVYDVLVRWKVRKAKPQPKEQQMLQFDSTTSGNGITSDSVTSGNGITFDSMTSGNGITSRQQWLAVKPPDVLETVINLPLPVIVLERCNPSQLCTFVSMYWWKQVLPKGNRPSIVQLATRGMIGRGRLPLYQHQLFELGLAVIVGQDGKARDIYAISDYEINQLMALELPKILSTWKINRHSHRTRNEEQLSFFATPATSGNGIISHPATSGNGITSGEEACTDAALTSGNGITSHPATSGNGITSHPATSGNGITEPRKQPSFKRKELKGRDEEIVRDSFETPEGEPFLQEHPFDIWQRVHPDTPAADIERLRRLAAEHDAPYGAYPGGAGMYWLGRAIEATINKSRQPLTLKYVRGMMRSWRSRTTAETSAYGWDAPNHLATQRKPMSSTAPTSVPVEIPADLTELWQRVLGQFQEQIDRSAFDTWLRETRLLELADDRAIIGTANIFAKERVERDYAADLATALTAELDRPMEVMIVIEGNHAA